jgi:hypothetical protein
MTEIIGTLGATIILVAFLLNQSEKLKNSDFRYDFMNLVGSAFLIAYAVILGSIPFIILNTVWGLVSLKDLIKKNK